MTKNPFCALALFAHRKHFLSPFPRFFHFSFQLNLELLNIVKTLLTMPWNMRHHRKFPFTCKFCSGKIDKINSSCNMKEKALKKINFLSFGNFFSLHFKNFMRFAAKYLYQHALMVPSFPEIFILLHRNFFNISEFTKTQKICMKS